MPTDAEIHRQLQDFLDRAITPAVGEVYVHVSGGVVTLTGHVSSSTQRQAIRDLVGAADGVHHVLYAVEVAATASAEAPA